VAGSKRKRGCASLAEHSGKHFGITGKSKLLNRGDIIACANAAGLKYHTEPDPTIASSGGYYLVGSRPGKVQLGMLPGMGINQIPLDDVLEHFSEFAVLLHAPAAGEEEAEGEGEEPASLLFPPPTQGLPSEARLDELALLLAKETTSTFMPLGSKSLPNSFRRQWDDVEVPQQLLDVLPLELWPVVYFSKQDVEQGKTASIFAAASRSFLAVAAAAFAGSCDADFWPPVAGERPSFREMPSGGVWPGWLLSADEQYEGKRVAVEYNSASSTEWAAGTITKMKGGGCVDATTDQLCSPHPPLH